MQLGHQLVTKILSEDLTKTGVKHVKGVFSQRRDYAIVCRLYYHYKIKGLRYDVAVETLTNEMYLGETTLAQIIMRERDTLEELKRVQADCKYLQKKLPHYSWF